MKKVHYIKISAGYSAATWPTISVSMVAACGTKNAELSSDGWALDSITCKRCKKIVASDVQESK